MPFQYRAFWLAVAGAVLLAAPTYAQDQPSLGDIARQARQQKQQTKDAQDKSGKPAPASKPEKVITDESLPPHAIADGNSSPSNDKERAAADSSPSTPEEKLSAEEWKSKIQAQKSMVDALQKNIDELSNSIQFAPGNCVANCVEWNEHQKQKQQEVERMRTQLETSKKQLEDMQDGARKQGYGSSVYEP